MLRTHSEKIKSAKSCSIATISCRSDYLMGTNYKLRNNIIVSIFGE